MLSTCTICPRWRARAPRSGSAILDTPLPARLREEVRRGLACTRRRPGAFRSRYGRRQRPRILPDASFAGQQATFLNVRGERDLLAALHEVFASLFNDRAIAYRVHQGFDHSLVGLSVGVQHMVRSDLGASGVMFTLDTDSGFRDVVFITSSYGLGETVVQGAVNPDEFYVYKPGLAAGQARNRAAQPRQQSDQDGVCRRRRRRARRDRGRTQPSAAELLARRITRSKSSRARR